MIYSAFVTFPCGVMIFAFLFFVDMNMFNEIPAAMTLQDIKETNVIDGRRHAWNGQVQLIRGTIQKVLAESTQL